jgi:hypothetical protein
VVRHFPDELSGKMGRDMVRTLRHFGCFSLLFGGALLGCTKLAVQPKQLSDPLLVTKPAVEGRPNVAHASPIRSIPPPPPPVEDDRMTR